MTLTINTNMSSIVCQGSLNNATNSLNKSIERMSTGFKINHASDDAAGYSIVNQWTTKLSSLDVATSNASAGVDLLTTADESYSLLTSHLQRIRDLTEQASNGTYGSDSLKAIQAEINARALEIDRIVANTEYNDIYLMNGSQTDGITLQVGIKGDANSQIKLEASLFSEAGIYGLFGSQSDIQNVLTPAGCDSKDKLKRDNADHDSAIQSFAAACVGMKWDGSKVVAQSGTGTKKPTDMLDYLDNAIEDVSTRATKIGAAQNRVSSAIDSIDVQSENLTSSLSTLRDTDVAAESSNYVQAQILQQASATLLATANQMPSIALSLI